jgi:hypothetical protein
MRVGERGVVVEGRGAGTFTYSWSFKLMMMYGTCYKTFYSFLCGSDGFLGTAVYKLNISLPCKIVLHIYPYITVY